MPQLTLWPQGIVVEIDSEQVLLEQLKKTGHYIKSSCGGHATCGDCVVKVMSGEDKLSPQNFAELKLLGNIFHITKERLSCQTKCSGDVAIDISGHQKGEDESRLLKKTSDLRSKKKGTAVLKKSEQLNREALEKMDKMQKESVAPPAKEPWFKHWENKDGQAAPNPGEKTPFKKLDGNKRPKMFKTPDPDAPESEEKNQNQSRENNRDPKKKKY